MVAVFILSCTDGKDDAVYALRKLKKDNTIQRASIVFYKDTLQVYPPSFFITGTNKSNVTLAIATVVASVTCRRVYVEKMTVPAGDSIALYVRAKPNFHYGAITIIGNLENGQKTVFLERVSK